MTLGLPPRHVAEDRGVLASPRHLALLQGFAQRRRTACPQPPQQPGAAGDGTFVHRNRRRPARITTSFPRLLGVDERDLHVTDLDAVDGTPIVDFVGVQGDAPSWPTEMLQGYWDAGER
nr:TrmO family methyltransferase [Streptomyces sp. NBC_00886]